MKKTLITALIAGTIGFAGGNAFWYLASPLWIDIEVNETATAAETETLLAAGNFVGADTIHQGQGLAEIFQGTDGGRIVSFSDFEVTNGPDLKVWLVAHPNPGNRDDVLGSDYIALGVLKGNIGNQNYAIPAGTDLSRYQSVVIWCEQFSVLFATAALES